MIPACLGLNEYQGCNCRGNLRFGLLYFQISKDWFLDHRKLGLILLDLNITLKGHENLRKFLSIDFWILVTSEKREGLAGRNEKNRETSQTYDENSRKGSRN